MEKGFVSKFFPKDFKFWAKSRGIVGVDIGSSSIKIVQLKKEKERAILETYGELAVGPYAKSSIGDIAQISEATATTMLKDLFKESGATAKEVAVSIPVKSSFVTIIKVPFMEGKGMNDVIKFEARKYIPIPISEVEMDWWVINSTSLEDEEEEALSKEASGVQKKQMVDILLVVIYKDIVRKYQNILTQAGLTTKSFEIELFSALRSLNVRQLAPIMIMDMGASSTKMSIIEKGVLKSSQTIGKGSRDITNAIARSLKISFERAEEMKRQIGLSVKPEHKDIVSVSEVVLDYIFSEAKQLILAYSRKYNSSVGKVILTGGGSLLNGILDMAVKNFGVEVVLADSFSKADYPPFLQNVLRNIGPIFSNAVGLAMKEL